MAERNLEEGQRVNAIMQALKAGEMVEPRTPAVKEFLGLMIFGSSKKPVTLANKSGVTYVDWTTQELQKEMNPLSPKNT